MQEQTKSRTISIDRLALVVHGGMFYEAVELYEPTKSLAKRRKAALYVNFLANKKQGVCLLLTWHFSL